MLKKIIKYVVLRWKYHKELIFPYSCNISLHSSFEGANKIYHHSKFRGEMGYGSYIGPYCEISANIGRFTSIAPYVKTNSGLHPYTYPYATTCPMFFSTRKQNGYTFADKMMFNESADRPEIGNDCWIGENVFIAGGIKISDGAVALAGSVITKDVPPYAIVGGVPAKVLKYRYDCDTIDFLMRVQWWNQSADWLKDNWELMSNIDEFKKRCNDNDN